MSRRRLVIGISYDEAGGRMYATKEGVEGLKSPVLKNLTPLAEYGNRGREQLRIDVCFLRLISVGGINHKKIPAILKLGADGVAVVTAPRSTAS